MSLQLRGTTTLDLRLASAPATMALRRRRAPSAVALTCRAPATQTLAISSIVSSRGFSDRFSDRFKQHA